MGWLIMHVRIVFFFSLSHKSLKTVILHYDDLGHTLKNTLTIPFIVLLIII